MHVLDQSSTIQTAFRKGTGHGRNPTGGVRSSLEEVEEEWHNDDGPCEANSIVGLQKRGMQSWGHHTQAIREESCCPCG